MVMNNKDLGNFGETLATKFLEDKNYKILDRNYRALGTEIDIIAKDKDELCFVEVKTRRSHKFGDAYEAVDEIKMQNIIQTARAYIYKNNLYDIQVRFDIIEVYIREGKINHIENAFSLI
ncbi:YraN family protein [Peptoniphilus raoultii]|uniref:YraN family protein n=1 Tax=Peptoniphilus raoultii TaxID=1776387 RepID=UPI0008DB1135|nr:YraN family protein [Peptoniphilus raoultii]